MRLFVAADLPEPVRATLAAAAPGPPWRPVAVEALHVTLAFLGERPASDVDVVCGVLERCALRGARVELGPALLLPRRRPRVCAVRIVERDGALSQVQDWLASALAAAGVYDPEPRPFLPHVTVARGREQARSTVVEASGAFEIESLSLYRSRQSAGKPHYERLCGTTLRM